MTKSELTKLILNSDKNIFAIVGPNTSGKSYYMNNNLYNEFSDNVLILDEEGRFRTKENMSKVKIVGNEYIYDNELSRGISNKEYNTEKIEKNTLNMLQEMEKFKDRFFDVGIAEGHAIGMAAGMATNGIIPVVPIYASFYQRGYDQVIHDVCMQNLHVVLCSDRAGIVGADGETHQGILDLSFDDLENDLYLKKICPDSKNKLVYCDNDICYYDCFDGDYLCIATKDAIKMKENHVHNNSGLIRLNELNSNEISIDYGGKRIKDIAEKYKTRDSIKYNSYITAKFKSIIDKQVITNDLRYVESCTEYESLKENLNDEDLIKINNVIKDFTFYENSYDDGERDILGEYEGRYGNYNIIEWYEGLKSTKSFLEDFKLERDDYSV